MKVLASAWEKLDWARDYRKAVSNQLRAFETKVGRPFTVDGEYDAGAAAVILRVKDRVDVPMQIGLLVGDFCHNARSALDHAAWQLVAGGRAIPGSFDPKKVALPIVETHKAAFDSLCGSQMPGVCKRLIAPIRREQPYLPQPNASIKPLLLLQTLDNADKHRSIRVVVARGHGRTDVKWSLVRNFRISGVRMNTDNMVDLNPGTELLRFLGDATGGAPEVKVELGGMVAYAFQEGGRWVEPNLLRIEESVERILTELEAVLRSTRAPTE